MQPEINFYNPRSLILFVCILQGVIFAILLTLRGIRLKTRSDFWLAVLLIVMCSGLIVHFIGFANVYDNNQWLTLFPFELFFAHAPVIYLYTKHLTDSSRRPRVSDLLLFVPACLYWLTYFGLFLQDADFKSWFQKASADYYIGTATSLALFTWNAVFLYLSISHYSRYRRWLDENYSNTELIKFNWLRNFLYIFVFLFVIEAIFGVIAGFFEFSYGEVFYLRLLVAFITYYLAVAGYLRSSEIDVRFEDNDPHLPEETPDPSVEDAKQELSNLMGNQKPYLDPSITLAQLSKKVGTNTTRLSHVINTGFGKNFNEFVNEYRIEDVKQQLAASTDRSILEIALDCGFNSKATFNRSFKKITGLTPRQYIESKTN